MSLILCLDVFFPKYNIPEDPVTGSAHCALAPYWGQKLQKHKMVALQLSPGRGGYLELELAGSQGEGGNSSQRTLIRGFATMVAAGSITLPVASKL